MENINYTDLFEKSPTIQLIIDSSYLIVFVTDDFLNIINTDRTRIIGKYVSDVLFKYNNGINIGEINDMLASFKRVMERKMSDIESTIIRLKIETNKDGQFKEYYYKPYYTPILDKSNKVAYIIQQLEDVTEIELLTLQFNEIKNKLDKIQEREKFYDKIFLQSPFTFAILKGKEMVITLANDSAKKIWGKGNDIEGKPLVEVLPEIKNTEFPLLLENVYISGIPFYGNQMLSKIEQDGKLKNIFFNFIYQPYFDEYGIIEGITIIANEVNDRASDIKHMAEMEFRYRSLIEESTVAIALYIGPEIRISYVNNIMLDYWGKNREDVLNSTFSDALPEITNQNFGTYLQNVYETGITYVGVEEKTKLIVKGRLQIFYFNFTYKAIRNKEGLIYGIQHMAIDVTKEVITKQQLQESEKRYKSLTKASTSLVWIANGQGEFLEPQLSWEEYTGQHFKDYIGFGWMNMISKESRNKIMLQWKDAIINKKDYNTSGKIWSKVHYEYRYFESVAVAFFDELGNIKEWVGTITDVHEQKKAIEEIAESEERFRLLVKQAPVAICVLRGDNYIIETINSGMAEMWDRKIENVLNKPAFDVLPELREQGFKELLDKVFTSGENFIAQELPISLKRNGKLAHLFIKFIYEPLRDASGIITGVMALAHDISEQVLARKAVEESENKFRLLTNTMPQKINTADAKGNVTYYNQKWLDDTGFSFDDLKNWGWKKAMLPEDIEKTSLLWKESLTTGIAFEMEYRLLEKGVYRWNLSRASPLKDKKGKIIMWVGTHTNIQHIKEEQEQKDIFIGKVSHELRTPVAIIKTYSELLQEILTKKGNVEEAKMLTKIGAQLHRLNNLVMGLLDVTKLNSGTFTINKTKFNFTKLVIETVEEIQVIAPKNKIIQQFKETTFIESDRDRIIQVITNLFTNAVKFSPEGSEIITHTSILKDEVIFSIQDFGVGIGPAEQLNIFKQFHRVSSPMQYTYPGLGLGLYISAEIIKQLNGRIWVTSIEGKGSTFYFTLPKL